MDLNPDYHFHGEHEEGNQDDSQSKYEGLELNDKKLPEFWILTMDNSGNDRNREELPHSLEFKIFKGV